MYLFVLLKYCANITNHSRVVYWISFNVNFSLYEIYIMLLKNS